MYLAKITDKMNNDVCQMNLLDWDIKGLLPVDIRLDFNGEKFSTSTTPGLLMAFVLLYKNHLLKHYDCI